MTTSTEDAELVLADAADLPLEVADELQIRRIRALLANGTAEALRYVASEAIGEAARAALAGRLFEAQHLDTVAVGLTRLASTRDQ